MRVFPMLLLLLFIFCNFNTVPDPDEEYIDKVRFGKGCIGDSLINAGSTFQMDSNFMTTVYYRIESRKNRAGKRHVMTLQSNYQGFWVTDHNVRFTFPDTNGHLYVSSFTLRCMEGLNAVLVRNEFDFDDSIPMEFFRVLDYTHLDTLSVNADMGNLKIEYAQGDDAGSVTGNIGLPTEGDNGSTILWKSSNSGRISGRGLVTRPDSGTADVQVKLTATVKKGSVSMKKEYTLTVRVNTTTDLVDIDGNVYKTLRIGSQTWTAENLRTTHYNDGTPIPLVADSAKWAADTNGAMCYYGTTDDENSSAEYGMLYNGYASIDDRLAPPGWRLPTEGDLFTLINYMSANGYNYDGSTEGNKIAKALAAKTGWASDTGAGTVGNNPDQNNVSGFSALPAGYRDYNSSYKMIGRSTMWWTLYPKENGLIYLASDHSGVNMMSSSNIMNNGYSVRLIRER